LARAMSNVPPLALQVTLPGAKEAFRLIGGEGVPLLDVIIRCGEARPQAGKRMLCRHPFDEKKRVYVTPTAVIPLLRLVWKGAFAPLAESLATDSGLKDVALSDLGDLSGAAGGSGVAAAGAAGGASASLAIATSGEGGSLLRAGSVGGGLVAPGSPASKMVTAAAPHVPPPSAGLVPLPLPGAARTTRAGSKGAGCEYYTRCRVSHVPLLRSPCHPCMCVRVYA